MIIVNLPTPPLDPILPQNDTSENQEKRKASLTIEQNKYVLTNDNPLKFPLLKTPLPVESMFDNRYNFERGSATVSMVKNEAIINEQSGNPFAGFSGFSDYEKLYVELQKPEVLANWLTDESFAEQRLSGANPISIKRIKGDFPKNLDRQQLAASLGSEKTLEKLIKTGALYSVDYSELLENVKGGIISAPAFGLNVKKYCPKPIALFKWESDTPLRRRRLRSKKNGRLQPIAIQIDTDQGPKIFTPDSSGLKWTIAKLCFSVADTNIHELIAHLGEHHFALEAFAGVTPRHLAPQHPLYMLLNPHLKFVAWNNQQGVERLIQTNGPLDLLMAGSLEESVSIALNAARNWSVCESLPAQFEANGVEDKRLLPHYPYRDDSLLIWNAINTYITEYLNLYYKSDSDVHLDYELQNWASQLADTGKTGGQVKDMPTQIKSLEQLIQIATKIIYSSSAGHSAVNFTQYQYLGFVPNLPGAAYANYHEFLAKNDTTEAQELKFITEFLPIKLSAIGQVNLTFSLSAYHYDQLGDYNKEFVDPLAKQVLYRFAQNLQLIENTIEARNEKRLIKYPYLLPSNILNSASI